VHLRDPDLIGDLALGEPLEEAQVQDLALARGQLVEAAPQHEPLLGAPRPGEELTTALPTFYVSGQLVVPSSRRGLLESNPITVSAHPELARCLRDADPTWLDPAASAALGVPPDLHASAMPIVVAGESLGLLVFVFADVEPHDEDNRRLLTAVSAAMGFALLRDRLAQELREAAGAPG
jgi:GAF domain-containing protein